MLSLIIEVSRYQRQTFGGPTVARWPHLGKVISWQTDLDAVESRGPHTHCPTYLLDHSRSAGLYRDWIARCEPYSNF